MTLLKVNHLTKTFGGLTAVSDVNLAIESNELIGLIGPNGAGKTTLFNLITGVYEPTSGNIEFAGQDISGTQPEKINRVGIGRTFQNIRLFANLTVLENVLIALHAEHGAGFLTSVLRLPAYYRNRNKLYRRAIELLELFNLEDLANEKAKNLAYGQQRRLEIVRALATEPQLLFLDEPAAGMNPRETAELTELIHRIKDELGITVVLIEHDMSLVMNICERIYVLEYGKVIAEGSPEAIQSDERVIKAYLGGVD